VGGTLYTPLNRGVCAPHHPFLLFLGLDTKTNQNRILKKQNHSLKQNNCIRFENTIPDLNFLNLFRIKIYLAPKRYPDLKIQYPDSKIYLETKLDQFLVNKT